MSMRYQFLKPSSSFNSYFRASRRLVALLGGILFIIVLIWIELFLGKEHACEGKAWLICQLEESVFMETAETFGFFVAVILFALEAPDRQKQSIYEAWKVIDAAHGLETSFVRIDALQALNASGVSLEGLDVPGADLKRIQLEGAKLQEADLQKALLQKANLRKVNLEKAKLCSAQLIEANLQGANLRCADLREANLQDANLHNADLRYADLRGAILDGTNITGVNFRNAILCDTDLKGIDSGNVETRGTVSLMSDGHLKEFPKAS